MKKVITNETEEDYCSFEVSKLLKEKGFNVNTKEQYVLKDTRYKKSGEMFTPSEETDETCCENHGIQISNMIDAPTHALAIKWIRENFKIHIEVSIQDGFYQFFNYKIYNRLEIRSDLCIVRSQINSFKTFEEATEAALLYTLKNLIS